LSHPIAHAVGRRKTAIARVRLRYGSGVVLINGRTPDAFFGVRAHRDWAIDPLQAAGAERTFDVFVTVHGGGIAGQAGAVRLGIARALVQVDRETYRGTLKEGGYLRRDSREVERKKYGLKKARRAPQYSKR